GALTLAQPPRSAERGRQSPHGCWVRLVRGRGPGAASAADSKPGRGGAARPPAAVHPGPTPTKRHRSKEGGLFALGFVGLMGVRPPYGRRASGGASVATTAPRRLHRSPTRWLRQAGPQLGLHPNLLSRAPAPFGWPRTRPARGTTTQERARPTRRPKTAI